MKREQLFERMTAPTGTSDVIALHHALSMAPVDWPHDPNGGGEDRTRTVASAVERVKLLADDREHLQELLYSRRERQWFEAACAAMQGLLANPGCAESPVVPVAVNYANELLAALDRRAERAP